MNSKGQQLISSAYVDDDTIDLGELIRNLISEWPLINGITVLGAVAGVATALLLPKEYRVEAIVSQPSRSAVKPLLAQQIAPLELDEITERFLLHVRSLKLIEQAYHAANIGHDESDAEELSDEEAFSQVRNLASALSAGPIRIEFYELDDNDRTPLNRLSINLLSSQPQKAKIFIDELLTLAEERTLQSIVANIEASRAIRIQSAQTRYDQLLQTAEVSLNRERKRLQQALNIANSLNIQEPTSWETLVLENSQVQMINQLANDELFFRGSRFLSAQIDSLSGEGDEAAALFIESIEQPIMDENGNQMILTTTPEQLQGETRSLRSNKLALDSIKLLDDEAEARIPGDAEKPNRPLIAIAATVLVGFAGLFIALIRIAVRDKN